MMNTQLYARDPVYLKSDKLSKKTVSLTTRRDVYIFFLLGIALGLALVLPPGVFAIAQAPADAQVQLGAAGNGSRAGKEDEKGGVTANERAKDGKDSAELLEEMRQMRQSIERLEARISRLEAEKSAPATGLTSASCEPVSSQTQKPSLSPDDREVLDFWRDTTVNLTVDGYYGYNFNRPLGGINLLRAYDVESNSFSLNQAGVIFEHAPKAEEGRRFGARLDLMYGQATETLQGSAVNELRPQVFRNLWQAYGTYVAPLGKGLTADFGKFGSALGYETNYTKDNFNYSRSYWFAILPFYHFGLRAAYPFGDKMTATYWLVNGLNQSEDFNAWKSQAVLLTFKPTSRITAQANYYSGREGRVRTSILNPTFPVLPTQPGLSPTEILPESNGRIHILDAYATFNVTDRLTFAFQGDYVITRAFDNSPPSRINGGVAYARYQLSPGFALAGRFEYVGDNLSDDGVSLFTGLDQDLKEITLTAEYKITEDFLLRSEYRRDWSNRPFFLTDTPGVLKKEQNTATLGLVWWFGRKKGAW
jgi:Putative beta-barrel porin-2, OmpL-like. bbp2